MAVRVLGLAAGLLRSSFCGSRRRRMEGAAPLRHCKCRIPEEFSTPFRRTMSLERSGIRAISPDTTGATHQRRV